MPIVGFSLFLLLPLALAAPLGLKMGRSTRVYIHLLVLESCPLLTASR